MTPLWVGFAFVSNKNVYNDVARIPRRKKDHHFASELCQLLYPMIRIMEMRFIFQ